MKIFRSSIFCIFVVIAYFTFSGNALAKCPYKPYTIIGVVQEEKTDQLIDDATLFFFFDDLESTLAEGFDTKYPDFFKTNNNGAFKATAYFPTYSGRLISDLCGKKPKKLTVIIVAKGFSTMRIIFNLSELIGENETIQLPPISIIK